jgi:hypothetical protein
MHRHKRFRHGPPLFRPHRHFGGWIWLIILGFLFFGGRYWPAILVLIGVAILFGSLSRIGGEERPPEPPPYHVPPPIDLTPSPAPRPAPMPVESIHRLDLLPTHCPQCGGPVRANEVKWTGAQSAACSYCGSNLPMKKQ